MSKTLSRGLAGLVAGATAVMKPDRRAMTRARVVEQLAQRVTIRTAGGPMHLLLPTSRSLHDARRFYESEPETVLWLDELSAGETLWDIGANIGIYTLYGAIARGLNVIAFEPSASSYAVLVRNIEINRRSDRIAAYCLAFDSTTRLDYLQMSYTEAGHSGHMFGAERGRFHAGATTTFRQSVPSFAIDRFCELFEPPPPAHVKLDVDGIEPEILKGGAATVAAHVKTLLVEIEEAERGRAIREFLGTLGFAEDVGFGATGTVRNVLFRRNPAAAARER